MTAPNDLLEHQYADWTQVSFADTAELSRGGATLAREDYPPGFDVYLPVIEPGVESFAVAKFPGKTVDFQDAVKLYLGPAWNSGIATDIQDRAFTGDNTKICDERSTDSSIPGWNLMKVCVERNAEGRSVANLYFRQQTGEDEVVASWSWG